MNNKIKILIVIVLIITSFVGGIFFANRNTNQSNNNGNENANQIKYSLEGIYITDKVANGSRNENITHSTIKVMTFYNNGTVSQYQVNIYDIKGIGTSVSDGAVTSARYTLSNESKTILLDLGTASHNLTFENDYKTIKSYNEEYHLINGSIDDYIPKSTINKPRDTEFSGVYKYEKETIQSTERSKKTYKGKELAKTIERGYLDFSKDGTFTTKNEIINVYADGTEENMSPLNKEQKNLYSIDKNNKSLFIYYSTDFNYTYTLSDDLKEITNNEEKVYKLVEN